MRTPATAPDAWMAVARLTAKPASPGNASTTPAASHCTAFASPFRKLQPTTTPASLIPKASLSSCPGKVPRSRSTPSANRTALRRRVSVMPQPTATPRPFNARTPVSDTTVERNGKALKEPARYNADFIPSRTATVWSSAMATACVSPTQRNGVTTPATSRNESSRVKPTMSPRALIPVAPLSVPAAGPTSTTSKGAGAGNTSRHLGLVAVTRPSASHAATARQAGPAAVGTHVVRNGAAVAVATTTCPTRNSTRVTGPSASVASTDHSNGVPTRGCTAPGFGTFHCTMGADPCGSGMEVGVARNAMVRHVAGSTAMPATCPASLTATARLNCRLPAPSARPFKSWATPSFHSIARSLTPEPVGRPHPTTVPPALMAAAVALCPGKVPSTRTSPWSHTTARRSGSDSPTTPTICPASLMPHASDASNDNVVKNPSSQRNARDGSRSERRQPTTRPRPSMSSASPSSSPRTSGAPVPRQRNGREGSIPGRVRPTTWPWAFKARGRTARPDAFLSPPCASSRNIPFHPGSPTVARPSTVPDPLMSHASARSWSGVRSVRTPAFHRKPCTAADPGARSEYPTTVPSGPSAVGVG